MIAASALALRTACDLSLAVTWHAAWDLGPEMYERATPCVTLSRNVGLVAFVLGLALVAAARFGERKFKAVEVLREPRGYQAQTNE